MPSVAISFSLIQMSEELTHATSMRQVLPVAGMTLAAPSCMPDGSVIIASGRDGGIRRLQPVPFQQQAESLADAGELEEALRLAQLIPDSEVDFQPLRSYQNWTIWWSS